MKRVLHGKKNVEDAVSELQRSSEICADENTITFEYKFPHYETSFNFPTLSSLYFPIDEYGEDSEEGVLRQTEALELEVKYDVHWKFRLIKVDNKMRGRDRTSTQEQYEEWMADFIEWKKQNPNASPKDWPNWYRGDVSESEE